MTTMMLVIAFLVAMVLGLLVVWVDYRPVKPRETHDRGGHVYKVTEEEWKSR